MNEILGNNYHCKKDISFSEFEVIHFNFIVQYVDVLNYKNPNDKFFYRIETKIEKDNYSVNHLNFFPSLVKTNKGIIFDNYQEEISMYMIEMMYLHIHMIKMKFICLIIYG